MTRLLIAMLLTFLATSARAACPSGDVSFREEAVADTVAKKRKGLINWVLDYLNNTNKNKNHRKFDFSVLPGPHYNSDKGFGIGVIGMGLYRHDRRDTLSQPSNVSVFGDFTTKSSYTVGVGGTHVFPYDRGRIDYEVAANYFKESFWGIGYEMANDDANEGLMKRWKIDARADFLWKVAGDLFVGPSLTYDYAGILKIDRPELLAGQDTHVWNIGIGLCAVYDTRDVMTRPSRGVYISFKQLFRPKFLGSGYAYATTDFRLDAYGRLWKGAVVAGDLCGTFNFGHPSWATMALLGNSSTMRGYYAGRYRDKHILQAQVELRQHVWKRNGLVVWGGLGTVFDRFGALRADRVLPNWGIGYRWEFKKNANVRLDYGFGKRGMKGIIFNINEAF